MYLILSALVFAYVSFLSVIVWNDVVYVWALLLRRLGRGGRCASLLSRPYYTAPSDSGEEPMSLEAAFDQPARGSPAWLALERLAGRIEQEDAAVEVEAAAPGLGVDVAAASPHSSALLHGDRRSVRNHTDPEYARDDDGDGDAHTRGGSSPYQQLGYSDLART